MFTITVEIRRGTYYDSVVLMQLQAALATYPGITNAGVMMGTAANKALLKQNDLLTQEAQAVLSDDLIIAVQGESEAVTQAALAQVDDLLARRRTTSEQEYLPKSLEAATQMRPDATWVLVSVPGRYAAGVAREALRLNKNVFLYSDNVALADEVSLKKTAVGQGSLVMGPDCGTAIVNGVGLGFANRVRRGGIGLVGASGTGLQQVTARIHRLGSGITHALGTGGRDLTQEVQGITARQSLNLLARDPDTKVIVLISKPPAAAVAADLLRFAQSVAKPVIINFIGYTPPAKSPKMDNLYFAASLDDAADLAVKLTASSSDRLSLSPTPPTPFASGQRYLRGLFSGGTLAYEAQLILQDYLAIVYSNAPLNKERVLTNALLSQGHTIIDLGEDEFTQGRLHPMLDNGLRLQRLRQEAADPEVAIILLDVVLGYGAHPNPAAELAPAIAQACTQAEEAGRHLEIVAVLVGTDEDPQDYEDQVAQLKAAGARVETGNKEAAAYVGRRLQGLDGYGELPAVDLAVLQQPLVAINVGLESFAQSLSSQEAAVIHVDWRPPAGGNEKLMSILERMKNK